MRNASATLFLLRALLAIALAALSGSALAQAAGRVVLAVGDVTAVRGADRVRLGQGGFVNSGDSIVTGANSHAQIRFSDEALVALKPDSEFRIEQYNYNGQADGSERAVFRLVRGGFRTLTGRVGQVNRDTYQVLTTQATIGIRGTHYALDLCARDQCRETADGPASPPGLYGGVYDGRVATFSPLGSAEFGAREFFIVPEGGVPSRLIGPPTFLADRLVGGALTAKSAPANLQFPKSPEVALGAVEPVPPFVYQSTEDRNLLLGEPPEQQLAIVGSDRTTLEFGIDHGALDAEGRLIGFNNGSLVASLGTATLADAGRDLGTGLNWGRWEGPGSSIAQTLPNGDVARNDGGNLHYIYGTVPTNLPTSGVVDYIPVGGTRPTDSGTGATGTLISGGNIQIDFGAARLALSGLTVGFTNATYTLGGTANLVNGLFSSSPTGATSGCTGTACQSLIAGNFAGFLSGPGGIGIGMDYFFNTRAGVIEGVVGYRRCAAPGNC